MSTCAMKRDQLRPTDASVCGLKAYRRCVACTREVCLTHLHAAADGGRCTDCYLPYQWADGDAPDDFASILAVARLAFQAAVANRYKHGLVMFHKGDMATDEGAGYRAQAARMLSEAVMLEIGITYLMNLLDGIESDIADGFRNKPVDTSSR